MRRYPAADAMSAADSFPALDPDNSIQLALLAVRVYPIFADHTDTDKSNTLELQASNGEMIDAVSEAILNLIEAEEVR